MADHHNILVTIELVQEIVHPAIGCAEGQMQDITWKRCDSQFLVFSDIDNSWRVCVLKQVLKIAR